MADDAHDNPAAEGLEIWWEPVVSTEGPRYAIHGRKRGTHMSSPVEAALITRIEELWDRLHPPAPVSAPPVEWPCLWCGESLARWGGVEDFGRVLVCRCGCRYAVAMVERADPAEWAAICERDGYFVERTGDDLVVTVIDREKRITRLAEELKDR